MPPEFDAVDLFAGPGGWDEGARVLGLRTVGVEYDHGACRTAVAAGHPRVRADVRTLPMAPFLGIRGLIASPPCPTFSSAGKGSGRHDLPLLLEAIARLGAGEWPAEQIAACDDERTALTLEPLRWALFLRPEWIVLEQVPAVLPVWEAMAEVLRQHGYSAAAGNLQAEEYGVPQTRKRAVLVASRTREVALPAPTHTRYVKGKPRQGVGLLPWVSMADALGWGMTDRPYPVLATSRTTGGPDKEKVGGSAARAAIYEELAAGRWVVQVDSNGRAAQRRADEPAPTVKFGNACGEFGLYPPSSHGDRAHAKPEVRLGLEDAAVLQTFPEDYPWHGSSLIRRFRQVGNAVPPLLAVAVLEAVL